MEQRICPLSMATENLRPCTYLCKFYNKDTGECVLVEAAKNLAEKN